VIARLANSDFTFDIGRHEPPKRIELKLAELPRLLKPLEPRTAASAWFNREIRRQAGVQPTSEED
jgi:hypothetical protein